jgi:hypothetical protein
MLTETLLAPSALKMETSEIEIKIGIESEIVPNRSIHSEKREAQKETKYQPYIESIVDKDLPPNLKRISKEDRLTCSYAVQRYRQTFPGYQARCRPGIIAGRGHSWFRLSSYNIVILGVSGVSWKCV